MKSVLKISLLLNLLLFITVVLLSMEEPRIVAPSPALESTAASVTPSPHNMLQPFRWSQLESTNYPAYVQNLRNIGCPEQTIRDIVVADVDQLYAQRVGQLRRLRADSDPAAEAGLQKLASEKTAVIAYLLGTSAAPVTPYDPSPAPQVSLPLVWQSIDPSKLNLEPGQIEALGELRQSFLDLMGGQNQDTNSPAYLDRWQKAQTYIDEQLAGAIGRKAYLEYESFADDSKASASNSGQ